MRSLHRSPPRLRLWLVLGVLLLAPASGSATTLYYVEVFAVVMPTSSPQFAFSGPSPTPVSIGASDYFPSPHGSADANANTSAGLSLAGATSVSGLHPYCDPPFCNVNPSASAGTLARFSGYDVILSGPSGESTLASLNLTFDGVAGPTNHGGAGAGVGTRLSGPSGNVTDAGGIDASTGGSGLLSGWLGSGALAVTTSTLLVGAGDVVTVDLNLSVSASCSTSDPVIFCGASSSVRSFSFARAGPVFNLPDGWTANSVDGSIVNNMFIPEPSTASLLLLGLLTLTVRRRCASSH